MIAWSDAYRRTVVESTDFRLLFGRLFSIDEFRCYAYPMIFDSLAPALLASTTTAPNTGSMAVTFATIAAPGTNIVPGEAAQSILMFPAGAIVLGVTAAASLPQRIARNEAGDIAFANGPTRHPGKRDLFLLDLMYADTSPIVGSNPIPEVTVDANSGTNTAPPILADALLGGGGKDVMPGRELLVTPGLGLIARVRSMVLPNAPAETGTNPPNLSVHLVFHCMVPGVVRRANQAA